MDFKPGFYFFTLTVQSRGEGGGPELWTMSEVYHLVLKSVFPRKSKTKTTTKICIVDFCSVHKITRVEHCPSSLQPKSCGIPQWCRVK